jgi:Ser/Thr protein kinase RdoA (MazF antagonist)
MYYFITDASCYDIVEKTEDFYESAVTFGKFQCLLASYPAETLHETIPNFHHTAKRYETFLQAVEQDVYNRASEVQEEIAFVMKRAEEMHILTDMLEKGELPLRVTHNDTKLNNIMIDNETGKGICILDLDTVMPGLSVNDFGDAIRFGANTALEDETDLNKVSLDLGLYEIFAKGFLEGCQGILTENERKMLPMGAKMMTLECGMRFLTDYLEGDTYFKIHRKHHNLDRCRCQFALVADMERKWDKMTEIVQKY